MEILITGGNGLLGRHLVQALQRRGETVRVLELPGADTSWLEQRKVTVFRGDVCKPETLAAPMVGADAVLHLAAMIKVWRPMSQYRAVNAGGTRNVCRAALSAGVARVVHVSTVVVYGFGVRAAVSEDFPLRPLHEPYSASKAEGDLIVQHMIAEEGLPAAIVRPGTFYGPGDRLNFGRIADRLRTGRATVVGRGDNTISWVYVSDLVQGLLLALDHPAALGQAYNISNDSPVTQADVLRAIAEELGTQPPRLHLPYRAAHAAGFLGERLAIATRARIQPPVTRQGVELYGRNNMYSVGKAMRELGYAPAVTLREGVALAVEWYRKQFSHRPASEPVGAE